MTAKLNFQQAITAGLTAGAAAAAINAVLFFIFKAVGVITDDIFIQPNQPLTIVPILISSIMPAIVGSMIFFLFEKYSNNGYRNFTILAVVLFVLTLANPFVGIPNVTISYGVALDIMHVVVAFALLYFIGRARK